MCERGKKKPAGETFQVLPPKKRGEAGIPHSLYTVLCSFSEEHKTLGNTLSDKRGVKLSLWVDISMSVFFSPIAFVPCGSWMEVQSRWNGLASRYEDTPFICRWMQHTVMLYWISTVILLNEPDQGLGVCRYHVCAEDSSCWTWQPAWDKSPWSFGLWENTCCCPRFLFTQRGDMFGFEDRKVEPRPRCQNIQFIWTDSDSSFFEKLRVWMHICKPAGWDVFSWSVRLLYLSCVVSSPCRGKLQDASKNTMSPRGKEVRMGKHLQMHKRNTSLLPQHSSLEGWPAILLDCFF